MDIATQQKYNSFENGAPDACVETAGTKYWNGHKQRIYIHTKKSNARSNTIDIIATVVA